MVASECFYLYNGDKKGVYDMDNNRGFFQNYRYCNDCKRMLPEDYNYELCPACLEQRLFREVRDYIRTNDVTEYDVAEKFDLPVRRVRAWIKEGRIEYRGDKDNQVIGLHCARCGELITIGAFCPRCIKLMQQPKATLSVGFEDIDASKMRYLDEKRSKEK